MKVYSVEIRFGASTRVLIEAEDEAKASRMAVESVRRDFTDAGMASFDAWRVDAYPTSLEPGGDIEGVPV